MSSGFADQACNNGILDPVMSKPPVNLEDIRRRLTRSRASVSPPASQYDGYVNTVRGGINAATLIVEFSERMLKRYDDDKGYERAFGWAFTAFPRDTGFNNGLSSHPQPNYVEGLRKGEYRPFPIEKAVPGAVLYRDHPHSLTLPHVAGELKAGEKNMEEARLQSAYAGAALVYARNQVMAFLGTPDPPGHVAITTFITDGKNLNFFAHYAVQPGEDEGDGGGNTTEYHQYPIRTIPLVNSHEDYKNGRAGLRNEQDHAREQS